MIIGNNQLETILRQDEFSGYSDDSSLILPNKLFIRCLTDRLGSRIHAECTSLPLD